MDTVYIRKEAAQYEQYLSQNELAEGTIKIYIREMKNLLFYLDGNDITKDRTIAYKQQLIKRNLSVTTLNLYISAVNKYLVYAGRRECRVKAKKMQKRRSLKNVISPEEYRQLLAYALQSGRKKYYYILRALACTGIRISELSFFTVEVLEKGVIYVENKEKIREIYLSDTLITELKKYCKEGQIYTGIIFRGNRGNAISRTAVYKMLVHMGDMTGIPKDKVHPHSFRHLFALTYMDTYGNMAELSDILGHSSLETTRIYTTSTVQEKRKRLNKLSL